MNQRHHEIVQWINEQGRQTLQAVADEFAVSVQTIRSDIRLLAEKGLLLRSHGEVIPFPHRENISFDQRRIRNAEGKKRIADLCISKIADYQSIFLGSGSSVAEVASQLNTFQGLQVMTTNLHAARNLCEHPDCELTISGGKVRMRDQDVIGGDAMRFFQRYRADIGIFSVAAINKQGHLFDFTDEEVMAREALVDHCHYRILVIDSTKFETESRCLWGKISDYDCVVTDREPTQSLLSSLNYQSVEILY
ncbi:DeoR/GlpR family DNA-binding transcription regulator [Marinomonas sp. GJ51-6]|uniref:DeoR/GlpR family DNA-binding transcription regulator n=1 Tax=Marinomonas sp. GJ51-6 TaxID=2992802 RepID=UPI0029343C01|nr:DeoR/GlpR family DNA-binding transcription regulator [Marinomonas sp. GJ51-6]WOD09016.1 DeoR/GlpR family DNA-binding transcription regulator [Marinomonas sp. GJ51-6]